MKHILILFLVVSSFALAERGYHSSWTEVFKTEEVEDDEELGDTIITHETEELEEEENEVG